MADQRSTDRQGRTVYAKTKTTFWLQAISYALIVVAGFFWLFTPSLIAVNQLGPLLTPSSGLIALVGASSALYGHMRRHWLPEQYGAFLVAIASGFYAYSIAIDSIDDSTKGMGFCVVAAFFVLCVLRIFQIERSTTPSPLPRRLSGTKV